MPLFLVYKVCKVHKVYKVYKVLEPADLLLYKLYEPYKLYELIWYPFLQSIPFSSRERLCTGRRCGGLLPR